MSRHVLVSLDPADKVIKGGPLLWDGVQHFELPGNARLMKEDAALAAGYSFPTLSVGDANTVTLRDKALAAIAVNATYLAIQSPTATQMTVQVNRLTRQNAAIVRLLLNLTDDTSGT